MRIYLLLFCYLFVFVNCKEQVKAPQSKTYPKNGNITYAKGFSIEKQDSGISIIKITSPWPQAEASFTYALIPKEKQAFITLDKNAYDAIITVPVEDLVVTSTTHIPALEALGELDKLTGFSDTKYISSKEARKRIDNNQIKELGVNESLNTEAVIALQPDVVIGFALNGNTNVYKTLQRSNIPVIFNGDWVEESPLGKAEWIKFFAPFFNKEAKADSIFNTIEQSYLKTKKLAQTAKNKPTVLSGALYKDVWYLPGGNSWAANFLKDANANYLWQNSNDQGSLSLSWEQVLKVAQHADYWIAPAQFKSYDEMRLASEHYMQFNAFKNKKVFTFANTLGETGGSLYYELAPQRPDLVLKDLIHILHPQLLPDHEPFFFKPLL
ncbi:ABC transporter substrate-binding protein [Maribacter sp. LLG6340-A2]|uniref:ABC transporter substrate-binding protein n=1 Tax=Maribacter sp. LLG6340-A2 TaxID=3160834 RepID=UPI00386F5D53